MSKLTKLLGMVHCSKCDKYVTLRESESLKGLVCSNELYNIHDVRHRFHKLYCSMCEYHSGDDFFDIGIDIICGTCFIDRKRNA